MSLLWTTAVAAVEASWEDASPGAQGDRAERVKGWLDRQPADEDGTIKIPSHWGTHIPMEAPGGANSILTSHGWPGSLGDEHWPHLPKQHVPISGNVHYHQDWIYPGAVKEKIDQGTEEPGSGWDDETPKVIRHKGQIHILDGTHRYARDRLMGRSTMTARVYDTSDPAHRPENCPDCRYLNG